MQISEERVSQGRGCQSSEQESDGGGRKEAVEVGSAVLCRALIGALFSVRSEGLEQERDMVQFTF